MFFAGSTQKDGANLIWKTWAPPKVKLFLYFALNKRTWTAERHKRDGLQNDDACALCSQLPEHIDHLMISCTVARKVRWEILGKIGLQSRFDAYPPRLVDGMVSSSAAAEQRSAERCRLNDNADNMAPVEGTQQSDV